ncbi:MAG TPA: alginate export family protein [Puia sp.]|uniref:alginate export family protein n=1 Tax=Puia sp. TaxID=2045100 RepID=UPI002CEFD03E|nr:alginate export family protein [Puia sp.]HVU94480.1 alginate export family protein [Puia sp.]
MRLYNLLLLGLCCSETSRLQAQWSISGELRTRTEWRNGYGTLKPIGNSAALFTSQRSRLTIDYHWDRVVFHSSAQDIRVWGQDASTISAADGNKFGIHEAWAELAIIDKRDTATTISRQQTGVRYLAARIGRQEISYDDQRLLGGLDWLQQARRHDAIVLKLLAGGWQLDLGGAFNQNTDAVGYNGTVYTAANTPPYVKDSKGRLAVTPPAFIPFVNPAGVSSANGAPAVSAPASTNGAYQDYKALQYLYVARTVGHSRVSALVVADYFGKNVSDSVVNIVNGDSAWIYGKSFDKKGVNARITAGIYIAGGTKGIGWTAGFYYQCGRDRDALRLQAWTSTIGLSYTWPTFTLTGGWDYLSGNKTSLNPGMNHRFDPLYGTPHKFWGSMDYFFVSTGSPPGGLSDPFLKLKYTTPKQRFTAGLDYHCFQLADRQRVAGGRTTGRYLGSEWDGVCAFALNPVTKLEWGTSLMSASQNMPYAKLLSPGASHLVNTWSYLMITILLNKHVNTSK